jgi:hypothetical protein
MSDSQGRQSETGPSSTLKPEYILGEHAERAGVADGWWAVDSIGTPILGPFPNQETTLLEIAIARRETSVLMPPPSVP